MSIISFILSATLLWFPGFTEPEKTKSCHELESSLGSQYEAIETIESSEFNFEQSFHTMYVMGVQKASYYSCGNEGYLIVENSRRTELFKNVPQHVWLDFMHAPSVNAYYQYVIRNNPRYFYY